MKQKSQEMNLDQNRLLKIIIDEVKRRGWDNAEFVRQTGVNKATISKLLNIEKPLKGLSLENAYKILTCLGFLKVPGSDGKEFTPDCYEKYPWLEPLEVAIKRKFDNTVTGVIKDANNWFGKNETAALGSFRAESIRGDSAQNTGQE